jgi:hypothetical protein
MNGVLLQPDVLELDQHGRTGVDLERQDAAQRPPLRVVVGHVRG